MDQGVRYVVSLQDMNVTAGLRNMETGAVHTEASIASLNSALRTLAGGLGLGFGMHELYNFGREAIEGAAQYETAVKRIMFASKDLADGTRNVDFINLEADKYKIQLQDATDAYGKFLSMVGSSGMASDKIRELHDNLLMIAKVKGITDAQMNTAVMDLGKMIESGTPDARHLRGLGYSLNGIIPYVAREMGMDAEKLSHAINKGHATSIPTSAVLNAITKQAQDAAKYLPEATTTIQSSINDISNDWLKFKNALVFDNRKELNELFTSLKNGIAWLRDHEDTIVKVGKEIFTVGEFYIKWKVAAGALGLIQNTQAGFLTGLTGKTLAQTRATGAQTMAVNELTAAIERMNIASGQVSVNSAVAATEANALRAANTRVGIGSTLGGLANSTSNLVRGALPVALMFIAGDAMSSIMSWVNGTDKDKYEIEKESARKRIEQPGWETWGRRTTESGFGANWGHVGLDDLLKQHPEAKRDTAFTYPLYQHQRDRQLSDPYAAAFIDYFKKAGLADPHDTWQWRTGTINSLLSKGNIFGIGSGKGTKHDMGKPDKLAGGGGAVIGAPSDRITGNKPITYNITIKEINGVKQQTVSIDGKADNDQIIKLITDKVPQVMADTLQSIVNDSQINQQGGTGHE